MLGLLLACLDALVNALTDAARKKVLDRQFDAGVVSVWCKLISCLLFLAVIGLLALACGTRPELPDLGRSFHAPPAVALLLYLVLNALLEGTAILLNLRALQVSPISYCVPFMALTPLFLLPAGMVFLHETVAGGMVVGVGLVVVGSQVVNRRLFAQGWSAPLRAMLRERGSRYMLMVAGLLTLTNVLDKWFLTSGGGAVSLAVKFSRALTLATGKCALLLVFFVLLSVTRAGRRPPGASPVRAFWAALGSVPWLDAPRQTPVWLGLAGVFEALTLLLMLTAMQFTVAAVVVSIKRAGVIFAVGLGYLLFQERGLGDRVLAALTMAVGVGIFFLTKPDASGHSLLALPGALLVAFAALAGLGLALHLTRDRNPGVAARG